MKGLFTFFSVMFFLVTSHHVHGQSERAKTLIQEDYASILNGINELKSEIRNTTDKSLLSELKNAQTGLINDYISGPYALFDSKTTVESAFVKSIGKYNEDNIKSFLINYSGKDYKSAQIHVEFVSSVAGKTNWYEVHYASSGEVSDKMVNRVAIVSISGDQARIRRLSFANREQIKEPLVVSSAPAEKNGLKENIAIAPPTAKDEPVPMITMMSPSLSTLNELVLSGSITNQKNDGVISAYINDKFINGLSYNSSQNQYHLTIQNHMIPEKSRSFDIVFRYDYGKKHIKVRKNIVLLPKDLITTNIGTQPVDRIVSTFEQED